MLLTVVESVKLYFQLHFCQEELYINANIDIKRQLCLAIQQLQRFGNMTTLATSSKLKEKSLNTFFVQRSDQLGKIITWESKSQTHYLQM